MNGSLPGELASRLITSAGEALIRAHALLLQPAPQNLDTACSALALAIAHVNDLQEVLSTLPSLPLAAPIECLHREIELISLLLDNAASYHAKLLQRMIEASATDVSQGLCVATAGRLSLVA